MFSGVGLVLNYCLIFFIFSFLGPGPGSCGPGGRMRVHSYATEYYVSQAKSSHFY